jgi:uncharacterized protein (TIGR02145 family)
MSTFDFIREALAVNKEKLISRSVSLKLTVCKRKMQQSFFLLLIVSMSLFSCKKKENNCTNPCKGMTQISWGGYTYSLVEIGCQCWFAENLRFTADIPEVVDQDEWNLKGDEQIAAWSYYDNDATNDSTYGKLYNWFAINTGKLCPPNWHVPDGEDWEELVDYLGKNGEVGGQLKTTTGWEGPNVIASNQAGFYGLPAGRRILEGFFLLGFRTNWWSSHEISHLKSLARGLDTEKGDLTWVSADKRMGYSCRCMRDQSK